MSGSLWVGMTVLVEMHQIWGADAFSMRCRFISLVITHILTTNTGLQGAMRGTELVMYITKFRHCLWNYMMKYGNYDIDYRLVEPIQGFRFHYIMVNIGSGDGFFLFDTKPLPEPMYWEQTGTIRYTRYRAICRFLLRYMNNFHWNPYTFSMNKINFKATSAEWPSYFPGINLVIWKCPRIIGYASYQTISKYVYKTMFLHKISKNIYILPIWASTVINQIVNKVKTKCIKTTFYLYLHISWIAS